MADLSRVVRVTEPAAIEVLVVEDDDEWLEVLSEMLSGAELAPGQPTVLTPVNRLDEARKSLRDRPADVIVLDLALPDASDLHSVLHLIDEFPEPPVVIVSGSTETDIDLQCLRAGADDFVAKADLTRLRIVDVLSRAIARRQTTLATRDRHVLREQHARMSAWNADLDSDDEDAPLSELFPTLGERASREWESLVARRLQERIVDVDLESGAGLRSLVRELGLARATPRDIAAIHVDAMRRVTDEQTNRRARALLDTGSIMLTEALGILAMHYRARAPGRPASATRGTEEP